MDGLDASGPCFFEGFRLDRDGLFRIDQPGMAVPVALGSRASDLLRLLVGRPGELIAKSMIMDSVWGRTAVEEANLTVQISALRRVLDQRREQGSCIQTVSGRGYRFVGEVSNEPPLAAFSLPEEITAPEQITAPAVPVQGRQRWRYIIAAFFAVLCLVVVGAGLLWNSERGHFAGRALPAPRLSIVVLPFVNLSEDGEQQYFADAVTEDLTTDLSRISGSFVISRNTAFTYRNKPVDARRIGQELGVRYVLEGAVQRSSSQLRINVQLIDAETGAHLWAERIDRDMRDLFAVQDEITARIGNALKTQLINAEAARPIADLTALDYFFRGRAAFNKGNTPANYATAIELYERALAVDPSFTDARISIAIMLVGRMLDDMTTTPGDDIALADSLLAQASQEGHPSPQAHFAKGQLLRARGRCAEAIPEYETALAANRNWAMALSHIGRCKTRLGLVAEAIPFQEQAIRLGPADADIFLYYFRIGEAHLLEARTEEAIRWLERARSANPAAPIVHTWLASAYANQGDLERAAAELATARTLKGQGSYASIRDIEAATALGPANMRALYHHTYFAGLRKAGVPDD